MSNKIIIGLLVTAFTIFALPLPQMFTTGVMFIFTFLDLYYIIVMKVIPDIHYLKWILFFFSICAISVIWSIDVKKSVIVLFARMMPVFSVTFFISLYAQTYNRLEVILKAFYLSAIIFLLYILTMVDMNKLGEGRLTTALDDDMAENLNSNYIAGRMVFTLYIGYFLYWKFERKSTIMKPIHVVLCFLIIYIVLISGSRTSLGILFIPLIVYYLKKENNILKTVTLIAVSLIASFLIITKVPQFHDIIGSRIEDAFNVATNSTDGSEDTSRLALVMLGWDWFLQKPIIGYGINCFKVLSGNSLLFEAGETYAHNNYIELLVDVGLIGFFIYYFAHCSLYRSYRKMGLNKKRIGIVVISLLVVMFFSDNFWVGYYNNLSQFLLCITFTIIHLEEIKRKEILQERRRLYI